MLCNFKEVINIFHFHESYKRYHGVTNIPVICDNHMVLDWPENFPVIGFQHGAAEQKKKITHLRSDKLLARLQKKAAKRKNTYWIACAQWISNFFRDSYRYNFVIMD